LTIETIKVLDVTFAPFVNSEKPHLFTGPAARLINIGAALTPLHTSAANSRPVREMPRSMFQ